MIDEAVLEFSAGSLTLLNAILAGGMPQLPTITPEARTLMPQITSRLASITASVRSMSMDRQSISSGTRLQATSPIEPMFRNALIVSLAGSITYSRNP